MENIRQRTPPAPLGLASRRPLRFLPAIVASLTFLAPALLPAQQGAPPATPPAGPPVAARLAPSPAAAAVRDAPPSHGAPLYNNSTPQLLDDSLYLDRLRLFSPEWMKQHFTWPSELERRIHAGRSSFDDRLIAVGWIDEMLRPRLPDDLIEHLVEMGRWQVLYNDWSRNVGADAFLVRVTLGGFTLHLAETPAAVVLLARPHDASYFNHAAGPVAYALEVAAILLDAGLLPVRAEAVTAAEVEMLAGAWTGHWTASGRGTSARGYALDTLGDHPVEFFAQGDLAAFLLPKGIWRDGGSPLLTRRFTEPEQPIEDDEVIDLLGDQMIRNPLLQDPGDRVAYYERLRRHLNIRTVEEFLGPMLFDQQGRRLTVERLDYKVLEAAISRLSEEQRSILLRQRRVDWLYLEGMAAFEKEDFTAAVEHWCRALTADPVNVRIVVLLDIATRLRLDRDYAGDWRRAGDDMQLHQVNQLLAYHGSRVRDVARAQEEEERRLVEVATLRAEGLNLYKLENYAASRAKWEQVLKVDPRNATAQLYINLCDMKLAEAAAAPAARP